MKVTITYMLNDNPTNQLEDVLNWPDITDQSMLPPLVSTYLDAKYGQGAYMVVSIEVAL